MTSALDWDLAARDYRQHRPGYPERFFLLLRAHKAPGKIQQFDDALTSLLVATAPEHFSILHRVTFHIFEPVQASL